MLTNFYKLSKVFQPVDQNPLVGKGRIFEMSQPGITDIEYILHVEPFNRKHRYLFSYQHNKLHFLSSVCKKLLQHGYTHVVYHVVDNMQLLNPCGLTLLLIIEHFYQNMLFVLIKISCCNLHTRLTQ